MHQFKYRGSDRAGWILASALAGLIAPESVLVPVPRASWRSLRYGIDPAPDLAQRLQRLTGCVIASAFAAPAMAPKQAGRKRSERIPAPLKVTMNPSSSVVLLDDVLTTGRTLASARSALRAAGIRVESAITATARGD